VHLHPSVILEALGGTPSKRHRLVTLGGCRLLDSSGDCLRRALQEDCGEAEVLSDFLSTWLKDQAVS
jgi:hypothetical protein